MEKIKKSESLKNKNYTKNKKCSYCTIAKRIELKQCPRCGKRFRV